jgi:hypothetical protein
LGMRRASPLGNIAPLSHAVNTAPWHHVGRQSARSSNGRFRVSDLQVLPDVRSSSCCTGRRRNTRPTRCQKPTTAAGHRHPRGRHRTGRGRFGRPSPTRPHPPPALSSIWVRENSTCSMDNSYRYPSSISRSVKGFGRIASHREARCGLLRSPHEGTASALTHQGHARTVVVQVIKAATFVMQRLRYPLLCNVFANAQAPVRERRVNTPIAVSNY